MTLAYDPTAYSQPYHLQSLLTERIYAEKLEGFTTGAFRLDEPTRKKLVIFHKGIDVAFIEIDGTSITFHKPTGKTPDGKSVTSIHSYKEDSVIDYLKGL